MMMLTLVLLQMLTPLSIGFPREQTNYPTPQ